MALRRFLEKNRITMTAFARECGLSRSAISRIVCGSRVPRPDNALRIVAATGGRVTLADLYQ